MQTFMSENRMQLTAQMLDSKRLNKQILEAYQILNVLSNNSPTGGWRNHPAVLMWKGHEYSLRTYAMTMIAEAKNRGIKVDKNLSNIQMLESRFSSTWGEDMPKWFGGEDHKRVVMTHKANLYRKDPIFYAEYQYAVNDPYNKPCCDKCQYYWPTHKERNV